MTVAYLPIGEETEAMADEERRSTDAGDEQFVRTVKAADAGLQISRRFLDIVILLILFGVTIGVNWQKFSSLTDAVRDLGARVEKAAKDASDAAVDAKVAKALAEKQDRKEATREFEMAQWRATMQAIAMIQQQGGGVVTLKIPKPPQQADPNGGQP